jgi:hypothetical protein
VAVAIPLGLKIVLAELPFRAMKIIYKSLKVGFLVN